MSLSICGALYATGLVLVAHLMFPVPAAAASPVDIAEFFSTHRERIRTGALLMVIGVGFFAPFGALLVARTRKMETGLPLFTYLQLVSFAATLSVTFLVPMTFALAAFRPDQDPNITQFLNDTAWFLLLYIWPMFTVWILSVAVPTLIATPGTSAFPRWTGYLGLVCGPLFATSVLIGHLKTGPFAYDGVLGVYIPALALGVWGMAMEFAMVRSILAEARTDTAPVS